MQAVNDGSRVDCAAWSVPMGDTLTRYGVNIEGKTSSSYIDYIDVGNT